MNGRINFIVLKLVLLICFSCISLFYYPTRIEYFPPSKFNLNYQDIYYTTSVDKIRLHGYYFFSHPEEKIKDILIVYFHGNAQNASSHFLNLYWLTKYGHDLLVWDYRGFGKSEGEIDHYKNFQDIRELIDFSVEYAIQFNKKIILWGQSLGGALLVPSIAMSRYQNHEQILFIVLDSTFYSYSEIINYYSDFLCLIPFRFIVKSRYSDKFSPKYYINVIKKPIIILHGTDDPVVPYWMGIELYELANSPKIFISVEGGMHSNFFLFGQSPVSKKILNIFNNYKTQPIRKDEFIKISFIE